MAHDIRSCRDFGHLVFANSLSSKSVLLSCAPALRALGSENGGVRTDEPLRGARNVRRCKVDNTYSEPELMHRTFRCSRIKRTGGDKHVEMGIEGETEGEGRGGGKDLREGPSPQSSPLNLPPRGVLGN